MQLPAVPAVPWTWPRHLVLPGPHGEAEVQSGEYLSWSSSTACTSGADAVSGDFCLAPPVSVPGWERVTPVRGITVAGNFYRLLSELEAVGNLLHHDDGREFYARRSASAA